jgi:nucleotide-binding universal stress UspA family protein
MSDFESVAVLFPCYEPSADCFRFARLWAPTEEGHRVYAAAVLERMHPAMEDVLFPWACFGDDITALELALVRNATSFLNKQLRDLLPAPASDLIRVAHGSHADAWNSLRSIIGPTVIVCPPRDTSCPGSLAPLTRVALGSASVPVIVPRSCRADERLRTIVVAVDLSPACRPLVEQAVTIAHRLGAVVHPVYVTPTVNHLDHGGMYKAEERPRTARDPQKQWNQIRESLDVPFAAHQTLDTLLAPLNVLWGDPAAALLEFSTSNPCDVILIGHSRATAQPRFSPGRTATHVLQYATCHVACYPIPVSHPAEP